MNRCRRCARRCGGCVPLTRGDEPPNDIWLTSPQVRTAGLPLLPHNVDIAADRASVLLVGLPLGGGHGKDSGRLMRLDAADLSPPPLLDMAVGPHPAHVVPDSQGIHAYVTDSHDGAVLVVDLRAGRLAGRIATGAEPHGLRLSPDGLELCVANMRSNDLSVIDVAQRREIARIPVGRVLVQVGFAPDGQWLFVANQGTLARPDESVSVIALSTRTRLADIVSGHGAHGIAVTPGGTAGWSATSPPTRSR